MRRLRSRRRLQDGLILLLLLMLFRLPYSTQEAVTIEADATYQIVRSTAAEILAQYPALEPHPPLYYLVTRFSVELFGYTHFGLRLPTLVAGILTPPLLYLTLREVTSRRAIVGIRSNYSL